MSAETGKEKHASADLSAEDLDQVVGGGSDGKFAPTELTQQEKAKKFTETPARSSNAEELQKRSGV